VPRCHDHKFDPLLQKLLLRHSARSYTLLPREDQRLPMVGHPKPSTLSNNRSGKEADTNRKQPSSINGHDTKSKRPCMPGEGGGRRGGGGGRKMGGGGNERKGGQGFKMFHKEIQASRIGAVVHEITRLRSTNCWPLTGLRQTGVKPEELPKWLDEDSGSRNARNGLEHWRGPTWFDKPGTSRRSSLCRERCRTGSHHQRSFLTPRTRLPLSLHSGPFWETNGDDPTPAEALQIDKATKPHWRTGVVDKEILTAG